MTALGSAVVPDVNSPTISSAGHTSGLCCVQQLVVDATERRFRRSPGVLKAARPFPI
jgi:hypothetical protein